MYQIKSKLIHIGILLAFQETQLIEAISWTSPCGDEGVVMVTDLFLNQDAAGIRDGNVQHHLVYENILISLWYDSEGSSIPEITDMLSGN